MYTVATMEPMLPEDDRHELEDIAVELVQRASALAGRLDPFVSSSVGDLVRSMNCYYSNLIEGHDTHPRDIDKAMAEEFSSEPKKRALQKEAKAHIDVQKLIDEGQGPNEIVSSDFVKWIHHEFCNRLPGELLWVVNPDTGKRVEIIPGAFREDWVKVGHHIPPDADQLEAFMARFAEVYSLNKLSRLRQVVSVGASHHRLLWIHPFIDGNGRVARLFSHALLKEIGVGTSLWSVARGLARNVNDYKSGLMGADSERRGDLDGRGNLSAKGLEHFCSFFLKTCLDQVTFMESLLEPSELLMRMGRYVMEEIDTKRLPKGSLPLLREALITGEFARGRASMITGYKERQAGIVLNALVKKGLLVSDTPKGPVRLGFPVDVVERWFPRLYPVV